MFGFLRYFFATMVVIGHLWPQLVPNMGSYAVFGFYILSGYLITLVLTKVYGFSPMGTLRFAINRVLRIYPTYLVIFIMAIAIFFSIESPPTGFHTFRLPHTLNEWFRNVFIIGLKPTAIMPMHKLVGVAWTLYVELFYYIAMALVLTRTRAITIIWFCTSLLFTSYLVIQGFEFPSRYYTVMAGSLPFSTGALIYYYKDKLTVPPKAAFLFVVPLYFLNLLLTRIYEWDYFTVIGLYSSYILAALLIIYCAKISSMDTPNWFVKLDNLFGDLSYPIYLCHKQIAIFISCMFFSGTLLRSSTMFFICVIPINIVAFLVYYFIEKKVNTFRDSVRNRTVDLRIPLKATKAS